MKTSAGRFVFWPETERSLPGKEEERIHNKKAETAVSGHYPGWDDGL